MQLKPTKIALALAGILALTLAGCGGGGSTSTTATPTTSLSGVAATGAAFTDATVTVMDSRGQSVGTGTVGADGTFNITLTAGAVAPFILTATRTSADGATESLVSVVPTGTGTTAAATVNISPVTNLIASRLSSSGDPTKLGAELAAGTSTVNATTVAAKVVEVQTILAPILTATGTTGTDPLTGTFATDGTGYDRLLDSIKVTITPASATATNVEIGIKQLLAEGTAPTTIQFNNGAGQTAVSSVPAIPAITANTLVPSGTAVLIAQHMAQLTSCFALPLATRVPSGTVAASITATECTSAFFGNAPASFKSNGNVVGLGKAFNGIFTAGGNGVVFSQGAYEFTRGNGDIVVSYKSRTPAGNEAFDTFALRLDTNDGKLKQIGNQYDYGGSISAYHQIRQFPTLSQSASNYYSTGYNINIPKTGIDRVEVFSPAGNRLILKPQTGYDNLQLLKGWTDAGLNNPPTGGTPTGTSFVRLRSEFADPANTANPSATSDGTRLFFVVDGSGNQIFANDDISRIPAQAVWTYKYYLTGTSTIVAATQYYKTRSRALTIPELRIQTWASLTAEQITSFQSSAILYAAAPSPAGQIPITDSRTSFAVAYAVPTGALPPTSLQAWGRYTTTGWTSSTSFADTSPVASTARSGSVACVNAPGGDMHCVSGAFANPTRINGVHLWARDIAGREFANFYALYQL